ncbi:hypothetical protein NI454_12745 [Brevundimonas diminuta]|uniref:hypothetical protein n=1 Tax=Brevundimonas diminuta TaxID=293 RepID=UPI0020973840|nr:hypothetical protein [Brevundimonas diminuta]MCO8030815.1 hypothetical protein [Brevundimonas diminuta]
MTSADQIRRLRFARLLVQQASDHARVDQDARNAACVMSLQDAIEAVLLVVAERVDAAVPRTAEFDKYFSAINTKIAPQVLPLQTTLSRLNRMRVQAKHAGVFPSHQQVLEMIPIATAFMSEVCSTHLQVNWSVANLSALVEDEAQKTFLFEAETALGQGRFQDALVAARKAFFLAFEASYDIARFEKGEAKGLLFALGCSAPFYAQNPDWIRSNVNDPFRYIVYDHAHLEAGLVKLGADPVSFWNVWRIAPAVYRFESGVWAVKRELAKTERADLEGDAIYVVDTVAELILRKEAQDRRQKLTPRGESWQFKVRGGAVLRSRAAPDSPVSHVFEQPSTVFVEAETCGLDGEGLWWQVYGLMPTGFVGGYLLEADVDRTAS